MDTKVTEITFDVTLQPGEPLSIPESASQIVGPGHWVVSIRPADSATSQDSIRDHSAFLNSYSPEDEGLYNDYSSR
jgi:hypothetical protein